MMRKTGWLTLAAAVAMSLSLSACKDTKTLQENEQLKAQVADLQRQNGQLGNNLETVTAARDALTKENSALMAEMKAGKKKHPAKHSAKKVSRKKHRR
jgi:6-phosphofructokinase